ncbi:MAG: hypothetical protein COT17_04810 [Elusimicrobia bacterium CG08_land_8_20_14_0_20_51_18]|nr:MAG: hypothetical protein COT17_04810 [Elusimicrobia bacterium CG08_land_8_20_14_0_20_51_18]
MKKILRRTKSLNLIFLLTLSAAVNSPALDISSPLPNWVDTSREKADGKPPSVSADKAVKAAPSGFRIPAEYESVAAVVMSWAGYTGMLSQIAKAAAGPGGAQVWVAEGPESLSGVPAGSYSKINAPIDTVWVRDYGPFGLSGGGEAGIVDTIYRHYQYRRNDDAMPVNLGKDKGIDVYAANLILDGGNFMVDSKGNLFTTKRTYLWNSSMGEGQVDSILKSSFKVKNIHTFEYAGYPGEPEDGTGHIDMFMKLLSDDTVLISTAEQEPFKSNAEKAIEFFKKNTAPNGRKYRIITVKGWADEGGWGGGTWYTYTNSLIVNNVVLMPSYSGHEKENEAAAKAYKEGLSGATVVQINSDDSITSGGSIHCVTQTIPYYAGPKSGGEDDSDGRQVEDSGPGDNEYVERLMQSRF